MGHNITGVVVGIKHVSNFKALYFLTRLTPAVGNQMCTISPFDNVFSHEHNAASFTQSVRASGHKFRVVSDARMFIYKQQVEDLQTEQVKRLWNSWSTLLNNYGGGECRYENDPNQKTLHSRRKTKGYERLQNKSSRSPNEADLKKKRSSLENRGTMKL